MTQDKNTTEGTLPQSRGSENNATKTNTKTTEMSNMTNTQTTKTNVTARDLLLHAPKDAFLAVTATGDVGIISPSQGVLRVSEETRDLLNRKFTGILTGQGCITREDAVLAPYRAVEHLLTTADFGDKLLTFVVDDATYVHADGTRETVLVARYNGERYLLDRTCREVVQKGQKYDGIFVRATRGGLAHVEPETSRFVLLDIESERPTTPEQMEYARRFRFLRDSPLVFRVAERRGRLVAYLVGHKGAVTKVAPPATEGGSLVLVPMNDPYFFLTAEQERFVRPGEVYVGAPRTDACQEVYLDLARGVKHAETVLSMGAYEHYVACETWNAQYVRDASRRLSRRLERMHVPHNAKPRLAEVVRREVEEAHAEVVLKQVEEQGLATLLRDGRLDLSHWQALAGAGDFAPDA